MSTDWPSVSPRVCPTRRLAATRSSVTSRSIAWSTAIWRFTNGSSPPKRTRTKPVVGDPMEDVIQVQDQFYILATASKTTERVAVLQHDDTFAVFDLYGDVGAFGAGEQGLYHEGTRYLSTFRLRLNGRRPLLLSARVK